MLSLTVLTTWSGKFSKIRVRPRLYCQWQNTLIIFALAPVRYCVFYALSVKHTSPNQDKLFNLLTAIFQSEFSPTWSCGLRQRCTTSSEWKFDLTKWRSTVFKYCWLMSHFIFNPFTTIHDGHFRCHSSCYVTIHDGNFRRIYYSYTRIPGSWHALRAGSEVVNMYKRWKMAAKGFNCVMYIFWR